METMFKLTVGNSVSYWRSEDDAFQWFRCWHATGFKAKRLANGVVSAVWPEFTCLGKIERVR